MLNIKVGEPGIHVEATGSLDEITAEICIVINSLYNTVRKQDDEMATGFRYMLAQAITDPKSPVWGKEIPGGLGLVVTIPRKLEGGTHGD